MLAVQAFQAVESLAAQTLTGPTGLVTVPTAELQPDGAVTAGLNRVDADFHRYDSPERRGHDALVQYATLGFLPFVEVGLRLTRVLDVPRQALGDRFVSVRVRLVEEGAGTPAVALGVHDLVGTRIFHAEYVAASKKLAAGPLGEVGVHLGYGGDWLPLRAEGRQFLGPFGGVSVAPRPWAVLLVEHDAERVNAGLRLLPWRLSFLAALHDLRALSWGIGYTHPLTQ
ncbi:MAG TPA: YjbH domain-containing protein [Longimicrobiaceae bacterium]|nr:YjbH domain-containing protein [Longimicrobiaceae bacterium]